VTYAVNVGSQAYAAHNGVVYSSEFGQFANFDKNVVGGNVTLFWLAVHGTPVLFWKGISSLKFPFFLFMHANCPIGDGNQSSFGRFRYYYVNYRTFARR